MTLLGLVLLMGSAARLPAAEVWVRFGTEFESQLDTVTSNAGVADFSLAETSAIEATIMTELNRVYDGYDINFSTTDVGGTREIINFGSTQAPPGPGANGVAPVDFGNRAGAGGSAIIFTQNHGSIIESNDSRANQLRELGMALASTGAHELLHTLGGRHGNAYSAVGITPANYGNTGGLQATQVLSTGASGATERIREAGRDLSPWSRVNLDIAGGLAAGGEPVVGTHVTSTLESGDAGDSVATATSTTLTRGESSGQWISLIEGDLDGNGFDRDYFTFSAPGAGLFTAEVHSIQLFNRASEFNATLTLFDLDGVTPLLTVDDTRYGGNVFGSGTLRTVGSVFRQRPADICGGLHDRSESDQRRGWNLRGDRYVLVTGLALDDAH